MAITNNVTTGINVQAWPKMLQRTNHFLMDYYGLQADYSAIVAYAESNPAAAVGQIIYAQADDAVADKPLGLYVIKAYGEGAIVEAVGTGAAGVGGSALIVNSYEDLAAACEDSDNSGRIVILTATVDNGEEGDTKKEYLPGLYIIGSGTDINALEKISTSAADGSSVEDQVAALNTQVGNLETVVGSGDSGLVGRVGALEEANAQENIIEGITVNGEAITPVNKIVNIEIDAVSEYTLEKDDDSSEFAAVYHFKKDGVAVGDAINIPKDMVVSSGTVETKTNSGEWGEAGTYIVLTLANAENDTLYIPAGSLIEYITGGDSDEISVSVDSITHVATANLISGSIAEGKLNAALRAKIDGKVDSTITSASGDVARIFNEVDGGGAKFEHHDGTEAYIGVHNGGESGMMAQIYADKYDETAGKWEGSTIKVYHDKIYYQNKENRTSGKPSAGAEIATKGDIAVAVASVEVKIDNNTIQKDSAGALEVCTANLAVAGADLGVVKNGGNVEVSADGTMNVIWTEL